MNNSARATLALAGLMAITTSSQGAVGDLDTTAPGPSTSLEVDHSISMVKAGGCEFAVKEGPGYKEVTDRGGRKYTLTYDRDGRLAELFTPSSSHIVVYVGDSNRPVGVINSKTGAALRIPAQRGPEFIASMLAQGKLPTVDKILARLCTPQGDAKVLPEEETYPQDFDIYLDESYYFETGMSDLDGWWITKPPEYPPIRCEQNFECHEECSSRAVVGGLVCVGVAATFAAARAPGMGAIAGAICGATVFGAIIPECRTRCDLRYRCTVGM